MNSIRFLQPRRLLIIAATVVSAALFLTLLYMRAESVSPQAHYDYTRILRDLRTADAETNGEALANRLEITRNYDALTFYLDRSLQAASYAADAPSFLPVEERTKVSEKALELKRTLEKKSRLVEVFKRRNAILRNSQAYFPSYADDFLRGNISGELKGTAEAYVRHVLSFARDPDADRHLQVDAARERLVAASVGKVYRGDVDNLLLHGDSIVRHLPDVNDLTLQIKGLDSAQQLEELNRYYAQGHEHAQRIAGQYRKLLYVFALLLTLYLAFVFIRLDRTRRSLVKAHDEVSQRYAAQLLAEDRLRLHATAFHNSHDGVVLADADGNVLDINPAFTRITGYERSEVIGRNPRMIKSGRHDREFYAAMWKSILGIGCWQGEIWNRNKYGEVYPELLSISAVRDAEGVVTNFVAVFADISRLKEQEKQLTQMAYYDALTELPNRVLLADRLTQAIFQARRSKDILAVCYLDLDGFKPVNDTYGHEVGDRLLVEMAGRLKGMLRGGDTVARLGGDEFVLLLVGLENAAECEQAVQRLLRIIGQPLSVTPEPISLSASVGVTLFPKDNSDPDALLRHADQAMYQAKQAGKNRYHMFDHEQDLHVRIRHDRISRIEEALENGEFSLYYQPKVHMREGRVVGVEALIRWHHPERGLVAPLEFLPLVEEHDLIVRIGEWVMETALRQMDEWHDMGLELSVSVNVAGRQLQDANFVQHLSTTLEKHPNAGKRLELEILETSALEDMAKVSRIIEECRELGVSCALDDFGTGYSSLTYLKRLPAATIKIDQSFIREMATDPNNLVIVQGVLGLAFAFQRHVIAEGVETVEHGRMLMQLDCDYAQGYGIAHPMPADQVPAWVVNWRPDPAWSEIKDLRWDVEDRPMLIAKVEHRNWVAQLIHAIRDELPPPRRCLDDQFSCNFGVWYHGRGQELYRHLPGFSQIEGPHGRVHEIAAEVDGHWRNGQLGRAKELVDELLMQRDAVLAALGRLELEVAQNH
ncbi:MAG TPA: EAL domain-containing protein [Gallionella sp.]|nr:EAL domain-containing protein [Gallionella sp.]